MFQALALGLFTFAASVRTNQPPKFDDSRQILWQRSLDDALELAKAQQRPLLIAINADGESASERIVRERYRDPTFVESTRPFICVVGSIFRHTPRDYDDSGRRIPCPRLGEITCGEHIAMEPSAHERFLAGTKIELFNETVDRISPRHALIQPDGTKSLDLFLLFDLRELDTALADAAGKAKPFDAVEALVWPSARGRLAFEDALVDAPINAAWKSLIEHSREKSDAGWTDGLRRLLPRSSELGDAVGDLVDLAATLGAMETTFAAVRDELNGSSDSRPALLEPLASLGRDRPGTRSLVLSYFALSSAEGGADSERGRALAALHTLLGNEGAHAVAKAVDDSGGSCDPIATEQRAAPRPPRKATTTEPDTGELERALVEADAVRATDPHGDQLFGRAALAVAKRRLQINQTKDLNFLLDDASAALARASLANPNDAALSLDRAHVANYQGRFEEQEQLAAHALETLHFKPKSEPEKLDDVTVEALRWLGDACARQLGARASGEAADEARGILLGGRSLALAAASAESDAIDWLSAASFFAALGRTRERVEFAVQGLRRFPADNALRTEISNALWGLGRPEVLVEKYEQIASENTDSSAAAWYAGYALVLYAEQLRRSENPDGAIAAYERATPDFKRAMELEPNFRDSSEHYLALAAMGHGLSHLLAERQLEASRCVVEAAAIRPSIVTVRDGLDRDGADLIDGVLEWRSRGASPVDARAWLADLMRVDPTNTYWGRAISDALLREGLRADGRNDSAEGDRDLLAAIEAARKAFELEVTPETVHAFAQAATIQAERALKRKGDRAAIAGWLAEAAKAFDLEEPRADASPEELAELAAALRAKLGDARPVFRAGR